MGRQSSPSGAPRCPKLPKGSKNNAIRVENVVEGVKTNNISLPLVIIYNACILQMGGLPLSYIYIYTPVVTRGAGKRRRELEWVVDKRVMTSNVLRICIL